jgi:hypothetical protein
MSKVKFIFGLILILSLCAPAFQTVAQDSDSDQQTIESGDNGFNFKNAEKFLKYEKKKEKEIAKEKVNVEPEINAKFFISLLINVVTMTIIILLIYYPKTRQLESIFLFVMFNMVIFMLTFVLNHVKMSMGAAFGLFAIFTMLRYRTIGISIKDMTYLFIFIALGLISAIQLDYTEQGVIMALIIFFTFLLDGKFLIRECSKYVQYENIELIKPENREKLMEDLRNRTGLRIHHFIIEEINFLNDTANIKIFYHE